jgi:hypothetical protein
MEAASLLFDEFRANLVPYCPFVVIPSHTTPEALRREKPFLFLAILTAALYDNMPMQRVFESEIKKAISHRMVFDGTISFEVLQGLLVHITWYTTIHTDPLRKLLTTTQVSVPFEATSFLPVSAPCNKCYQ